MEASERHSFCAKHGNFTARVVRLAGRDVSTTRCPACTSEAQAAAAEQAAKREGLQKRQLIESLAAQARIPTRYRTVTLENYQPVTDAGAKVLARAIWYAQTWSERVADGTSLVLCGTPGTGKTHLACAIGWKVVAVGSSVLYATVAEVTRAIRSTYQDGARIGEAEAIAQHVKPALLILDEVGAASGSDHEKQMLFEIINQRYAEVRPTILISNLSGEDLRAFLGERIMDRLRQGGGKLLVLDWASFRK